MEALRELDSLLAEGAEKLPEAKAHVRVASSRLHTASESLLELAAALGAALAFIELAESAQPASQGGGGERALGTLWRKGKRSRGSSSRQSAKRASTCP
jgi:hypothetical protein